jgi:hypothetical protein
MVALNPDYAPKQSASRPQNRVGDFFVRNGECVGTQRPANRIGIGEKYDASATMASGHSKFASGTTGLQNSPGGGTVTPLPAGDPRTTRMDDGRVVSVVTGGQSSTGFAKGSCHYLCGRFLYQLDNSSTAVHSAPASLFGKVDRPALVALLVAPCFAEWAQPSPCGTTAWPAVLSAKGSYA